MRMAPALRVVRPAALPFDRAAVVALGERLELLSQARRILA